MKKTLIASISFRIAFTVILFLMLYIKCELATQPHLWFLAVLLYSACSYFVIVQRILRDTGAGIITRLLLAGIFVVLVFTVVPYVIGSIFPADIEEGAQTICLGIIAFVPIAWDVLCVVSRVAAEKPTTCAGSF